MSAPTPTPTLTYSRKAARRRQRDADLPLKRACENTDEHAIASSSKRARRSTSSLIESSQEQSNTPTRSPSPSPTPSLDSPPFRTPVKSTNSLSGLSPLTPLSATPLKRTSTHPMDHASTPTKHRRPADALSELFDLPKVPGRVSRDSVRSLQSKANKPVAKRMLGRTRSALLAGDGPSAGTSLESMTSSSLDASAGLPHSPHHIPDLDALESAVSQTPTISMLADHALSWSNYPLRVPPTVRSMGTI